MKTNFKIFFGFIFLLFEVCYAQIDQQQLSTLSSLNGLTAISVTIGGDFILEGSYPSTTTERLDPFITRMFNQGNSLMLSSLRSPEALAEFKNSKKDQYSKREIKLIHQNGSKEIIDLARFRLDADFKNNPYLKDGDVIIFPPLDLERNFFSIEGAVNKNLKMQYVKGDKLSDAIFFARGINQAYSNVTRVEISRLSADGESEEVLSVEINSDIDLLPGDRIRVLSDEMKKFDYKVLVLGEVKNPGYIPITNNSTTLKQVIEKVGGFTSNASLKFSELIRNNTTLEVLRGEGLRETYPELLLNADERINEYNKQTIERLRMLRSANLKLEDTLYFGMDNQLRVINGVSALDFRNLESDTSFESRYIIKDKDIIVIPEKQQKVYVWGGVRNAGYYEFDPSKSVWDYVNEAGSYGEVAFGNEELFLIRGKSYDWIQITEESNEVIEPGDFIYAKKDPPMSFGFYLGRIGAYASIVGSIAATILLLLQFSK